MCHELNEKTRCIVRLIAGDYVRNPVFNDYDVEDLTMDLFVHLLEIADQFDPSQGFWDGFIRTRLQQKCLDIIKLRNVAKRTGRMVSLFALVGKDEDDCELSLYDVIPAIGSNPADEAIFAIDLYECLSRVPAELRAAYDELLAGSQEEAATNMGVPRTTFQRRYVEPLRIALQPMIV